MQGMPPRRGHACESLGWLGGSGCSAREKWTDINRLTGRRYFVIASMIDVPSVQATGMDQAVSALVVSRGSISRWLMEGVGS